MLLYRYEKGGTGPYHGGSLLSTEITHAHAGEYWPSPDFDGLENYFFPSSSICWCTSLDNLKRWFRDYNKELLDDGYKILVLDTNGLEFYIGDSERQAVTSRYIGHEAVELGECRQMEMELKL